MCVGNYNIGFQGSGGLSTTTTISNPVSHIIDAHLSHAFILVTDIQAVTRV